MTAKVLHLARSGRLILQSNEDFKANTILFDDKERKVAKVIEIFGPIKSPYISATPLTDRTKRIVGQNIHTSKRTSKVVKPRK
ncbi:MAG: Gar1/Naf1 family protein [Nitrososphaerales archaeon]|jgi:rRNA processing protein Gar1|nr:Gar1/Naf1 family protein [Nitrososphaerales archaeon]HJN57399.1 Gar1/Naf1 family protein [Nitrososphaerales archaeon]|tara:strand:+ start:7722 stop:7970 length:249 start_codon:yes stop_codon:yes gene_type:complete